MNSLPDIQLIDDKLENLKLLKSILTKHGYRVRTAINGDLALSSALDDPPDLILLDIKMPGIDGYEVCKRLKAEKRTSHIPVIFLSAMDATSEIVRGFEAGGVDYITKPFQKEIVLARVKTHIKSQESMEALRMYERTVSASQDLFSVVDSQYIYRLVNDASTYVFRRE